MTATTPPKTAASRITATGALTIRMVVGTGLALGTAATVLAVRDGIRIPGLQVVVSVIVTWLLLTMAAITAAELLRRHHRAMGRHAWRHSKRGAVFTAHHTHRGAKAAGGYLASKAAARWENRQHRPLMFTRHSGPAPAGTADPSGTATDAGTPPPERKTTMTDTKVVDDGTTKAGPNGRTQSARRARNTAGGAIPAEWAGVIGRAADFEPGDDGELLDWMGDEVNGVHGYAEALIEAYETCTNGIGLDPAAMAALHDVADAATEAAAAMASARKKFGDYYQQPREFAGNGGLMPHDGRWVTGEGDA